MVVGTGVLKLQRQMPSGGQTILGLLKAATSWGKSVLNNPKRFASCVALSHGKAFSIRKEHGQLAAAGCVTRHDTVGD